MFRQDENSIGPIHAVKILVGRSIVFRHNPMDNRLIDSRKARLFFDPLFAIPFPVL